MMKEGKVEVIFAQTCPTLIRWAEEQGWVEIGMEEYSTPLVRALDAGNRPGRVMAKRKR